ncbi:hypothetical protein [Mycobacterium sp. 852014-52450_SCH5900713]|uniref:hypothetical protein n=1 Tax=Mycobacterium sp. 852014-52450_SCH5900713 TaxID=1834116 RepID=UPI000B0527AF|nr:hypothetical protein [Mycobacterium sp. 852014-52450_SCH5900713]
MSSTMDNRGPRRVGGKRGKSLRSRQIRALIAVALAIPLLLGAALIMVDRLHSKPADALEHPASPVSDDQSKAQVVQSAQHIVTATGLQASSAGYSLMSCKNRDDPPYQGSIYLTFSLPATAPADTYFGRFAATLAGDGWAEGLPPNNHAFAKTLTKDGVTVIVYRHDDEPHLGVLRVYGQCRNMNDHHRDATAWTDVTDQFAATR